MKLHANARTCPKSRRLLVRRIEEEGWSLAAAAEAAGVSERTAAQVARPLARRRRAGPARPQLLAPKLASEPAPRRRVRAIEALRTAADDRRRDRRVPGHGALDRLAVAAADRPRQALAPRAARAARTATSASERASSSTSTSRSSGGSSRRRPSGHRQPPRSFNVGPAATASAGWEFVPRLRRRRHPPRLRRGSRRREGRDRGRLPAPGGRLVRVDGRSRSSG